MRKIIPVSLGLALGIACAILGLLLGGAGHGWTVVWPFGLLSIALFPIALYHLWNSNRATREGHLVLLGIAVGLDYALYRATQAEGIRYFQRVLPSAWWWIGLWALWQVAIVVTAAIAPTVLESNERQQGNEGEDRL